MLESVSQRVLVDRDLPGADALEEGDFRARDVRRGSGTHLGRGCTSGVRRTGLLERFDGLLVGGPSTRSHLEDAPPAQRERYRANQREAISGVFERYNPDAPIVFDVDFGHTWPTTPIPIGGRVEIDPRDETIRFE